MIIRAIPTLSMSSSSPTLSVTHFRRSRTSWSNTPTSSGAVVVSSVPASCTVVPSPLSSRTIVSLLIVGGAPRAAAGARPSEAYPAWTPKLTHCKAYGDITSSR